MSSGEYLGPSLGAILLAGCSGDDWYLSSEPCGAARREADEGECVKVSASVEEIAGREASPRRRRFARAKGAKTSRAARRSYRAVGVLFEDGVLSEGWYEEASVVLIERTSKKMRLLSVLLARLFVEVSRH